MILTSLTAEYHDSMTVYPNLTWDRSDNSDADLRNTALVCPTLRPLGRFSSLSIMVKPPAVDFIPGTGRFGFLLPPDEKVRRYKGPELPSLNAQEKNRVAPVKAPNDSENDRRYKGPELQSTNFQEKNRVAPTGITTPNHAVDRKANKLPQQSEEVEKVFKFSNPPPSYEDPEPPNDIFCHGKTLYIDPKARDSLPSLSVEYKLDSERPNKIHLRIQVRNRGYWVSELEFRIKFCDGAVILLYLRTYN